MSRQTLLSSLALSAVISFLVAVEYPRDVHAAGPTLVDNNLQVTPVAIGFNQPTSFAFIGANDVLVLEKASGRVIRAQGNTLTTRSRRQQLLRTRVARNRTASSVSVHTAGVPLLDGKHHGI